jgi:hypothetical protein
VCPAPSARDDENDGSFCSNETNPNEEPDGMYADLVDKRVRCSRTYDTIKNEAPLGREKVGPYVR